MQLGAQCPAGPPGGLPAAGRQAPAGRSPGRFVQTPWPQYGEVQRAVSSKPCSTGPFGRGEGRSLWESGSRHADGTDLETTELYAAVARRPAAPHGGQMGKVHEIEVTRDGWNVLLLIEAVTKIPLAVKVGPIQEH